ncbi:MBOAT family O-acyltransferase [Aestuariibaculum sp. YM273]|uniref:MBOAT family O-acyltransferase n=1 Tax=Aestuariibaculum sp. YM273 TaxID=3070659 RepID=UPI0027DAC0BD|nr:MBOAT family O-acyltransferase [Aestuariibaculum sp. YM273]WMI65935.1 MBOAT family O-acyltransferase [Aestuariibaculum sp. YM273]
MLFNSIDFAGFLPIVFVLYWFVANKNLKAQNLLILIASYFFYGCWDWRFLSLILFSTLIDYFVGLALNISKNKNSKKMLLSLSVVVNLGLLCFFKYFNFFIDNFNAVFLLLGRPLGISSLNIILPVGISFYTFQTMSYTIDVYKNKIEPTKNFIAFAAFVAFFPQLVAGPIERAKNFLPQFKKKRYFDYSRAVNGLKQVLWGLFKKMVIADNCAVFVDDIFLNHTDYNGSTLLIGAFFFTIQIYCDFSGYSDIAIGVSRLFGFNLMKNFAFPYFSRNIKEFWRRWHISLTTWFKDYVYIPIGGSWGSKLMQARNTIFIFVIIGFWHGAHWKFIVYGLINGLHFIPSIIKGKSKTYENVVAYKKIMPTTIEFMGMIKTFTFLVIVRVFFRANSLSDAISYLSGIFSKSLFSVPNFGNRFMALIVLILIMIFFLIEWLGRHDEYAIENLVDKRKPIYKWGVYYLLVFLIFYFSGEQQQFIYFQF